MLATDGDMISTSDARDLRPLAAATAVHSISFRSDPLETTVDRPGSADPLDRRRARVHSSPRSGQSGCCARTNMSWSPLGFPERA
jgi:hypothetical protein